NLPGDGSVRINLRRDTHWEYFYDEDGGPLIRLYRRLGMLRRTNSALRSRESFYYWRESLQNSQLVAYHRHAPASGAKPEQYALVVLNFGASADTIRVPFPKPGTWTEKLDDDVRATPSTIQVNSTGEVHAVTVPSHYGFIYLI